MTPKTWAKAIYGVGIRFLFDECADLCADLTELECRHFFEEGYLAAKRMELSESEYISFAAEQTQGYKYTLELEKKMERLTEDWKIQPEFQRLLEIREWRRTGDRQLYYDGNEEVIQELKNSYCSSVGE